MNDIALSPLVVALAADVAHTDAGGFAWDDATLQAHADALLAAPRVEHRRLATEVLALVLKYAAESLEHTFRARAQLFVLFALLAENAAGELLREAGLEIDDDTRKAIGAEASKLPVGAAGRVPGALSPLGVRLKEKP
jgi:hypothetical protein